MDLKELMLIVIQYKRKINYMRSAVGDTKNLSISECFNRKWCETRKESIPIDFPYRTPCPLHEMAIYCHSESGKRVLF